MTLREAMKLLDLNERTLDISMLDSAARQRMDAAETSLQRDQVLEAYRRVQIFLDPSADERFSMRGSNVLAALSETRVIPQALDDDHSVVLVEDEPESQLVEPLANLSFEPANFDLDLEFNFEAEADDKPEPNLYITAELPLLEPEPVFTFEPEPIHQVLLTEPLLSDLALSAMPDAVLSALPDVALSAIPEVMSDISPDWSALQPILESKPPEPEFDDSLLVSIAKPRVLSDESSLTIIEEEAPVENLKPAVLVRELEPSQAPMVVSPRPAPATRPIPPKAATVVKNGNPERRVSRATQAKPVSRAYEQRRQKTSSQPPLWAWLLAIVTLVSTGIFAAPALMKQFAPKAKPQPNLSVPTLPQAPKPVVKPSSSIAKPKPVAKPIVVKPKPVVKPTVVATPKPTVTTPAVVAVPKPVAKPLATVRPVVKPTLVPVVKPTPVVKPKPNDPRSAAVLPPIGAKPVVVKPKPVAVKPKPVAVKPKPKPVVVKPKPAAVVRLEEPAPKPIAPVATPAPVVTPAPVTEVIDPNNLTREQIGRRFLNEKYYADWLSRGAQLKYSSWSDIPIATQVLAFADFRSTVLISLP